MPKLVRREPPSDPGGTGLRCVAGRGSRRRTRAPTARTTQRTKQRPDREGRSQLKPRVELLPRPAVHPDLAALAALPMTDKHHTPVATKVALGQREGFADPKARSPQHNDHAAQPHAVRTVSRSTHDRDDLVDARRVWRIAQTLVSRRRPRWNSGNVAGERRRPTQSTSGLESMMSSLRTG